MTSAIDASKPVEGAATTASVRANFAAAKSEIETLQAEVAALQLQGISGTYQSKSRAIGTTYTNATPKPIPVSIIAYPSSPNAILGLSINGAAAVPLMGEATTGDYANASFIIPPNSSVALVNMASSWTLYSWIDLS